MVRRIALVMVFGFVMTMVGCTPETGSQPSTTSTLPTPATSLSHTTSTIVPLGDYGLYRADPRTLEPVPGVEPLATGDSLWGSVSPNGRWVALNVWHDTTPESDMIRLIDITTGSTVAEVRVSAPKHSLEVDDIGTVYSLADPAGRRLEALSPGDAEFRTLFDLPSEFTPWSSTVLLTSNTLGWFGSEESGNAAIAVADLSTATVTVHELPTVSLSMASEVDMGDWVVSEFDQPAVVWDSVRSRVLVVHADKPTVSVVDLASGDVVDRNWSRPSSWADRLVAYFNPVALAKGPSAGTNRSAALSLDGETLYVATEVGEVVSNGAEDWHVEWRPRGIESVDTTTWQVVNSWDIPVGQVSMTPDGEFLLGSGVSRTESLTTAEYTGHPMVLIRTSDEEIAAELDLPLNDYAIVSYSVDGSYAYVTQWSSAFLAVDLTSAEVVRADSVRVFDVMGPASLVVTGPPTGS